MSVQITPSRNSFMKLERTAWTLILGVMFIITGALLRPYLLKSMVEPVPDTFWFDKIDAGAVFDIVLLGDSRTLRGLSPQIIGERLDNAQVLNFSFSGNALDPLMYEQVEARLAPESAYSAVVLAITPHSLTPNAALNEDYLSIMQRWQHQIGFEAFANQLDQFLMPITFIDLGTTFTGNIFNLSYYYQTVEPNGWLASNLIPPDPNRALKEYATIFDNNQVSTELVQAMVDQAQTWVQKQICVFALRIPSSIALENLENERSGFDEEDIQKRLEATGVNWISFPKDNYFSYDSSHLREDAAVRLSEDLAGHMETSGCF
jgi:hypothetical protein